MPKAKKTTTNPDKKISCKTRTSFIFDKDELAEHQVYAKNNGFESLTDFINHALSHAKRVGLRNSPLVIINNKPIPNITFNSLLKSEEPKTFLERLKFVFNRR